MRPKVSIAVPAPDSNSVSVCNDIQEEEPYVTGENLFVKSFSGTENFC